MMTTRRIFALALALVAAQLALLASAPATAAQRSFPTPIAAGEALAAAVRAGDRAAMAAVLGPGANDLIESGDPAEDMVGRARFVAAYEQSARIEPRGASRAELVIGPEDWRVPFPLVRGAAGWRFDARAGRDEVIARRVGRNELSAMQAALSYVDAQREYALTAHDGEGPGVYARRIGSAPGRHDGLYWTPTREDPLSPLGVLFTLAAADETGKSAARPYHGYFFRVLQGQGPHASGAAADYAVAGRMMAGFALVAYPARHRITGVRTFIVNQEGVVYSRDLGARTPEIARMMRLFDPDPKWRRETAAPVKPADGERMRHTASDRGCTLCHRESPAPREPGDAAPLAPSWREIAARYRGRPDAEQRLTQVVIEGADPADRHWKDRVDFIQMRANAPHVTPDEARSLVRWILSLP
jgi:cytochrome c551/c552